MEIKIHATPTVEGGRKFLRIESPVTIILPTGPDSYRKVDTVALWDTGATNTCIPMKTALAMGIPLGEPAPVRRMVSTEPSRFCQFYLHFPDGGDLFIPEALAVPKMQSRFVIGMDVMRHGKVNIEPDGQDGVDFTFTLNP